MFESKPTIARISTHKKIGQVADTNYAVASGRVPIGSGGTFAAGNPITLNNINGTFVNDMIVTSPKIQDGVYVTNVPAANQVELSEEVTLDDEQLLQFAPGYPANNEGEPYLPGLQFLSVYETSPFVSNLDIYWESTTSGLISDLNNLIINSTEGAAGVDGFNPSNWDEGLTQPTLPGSPRFISNTNFFPVDSFGVAIDPADINDIQLLSVTDQDTNLRSNYFELYGAPGNPFGLPSNATIAAGTFNISITTDYYNNVYYTPAPGNDRLFNFSGINVFTNGNAFDPSFTHVDIVYGYRKTNMKGFGSTLFVGDIALRADFGIFNNKIDAKKFLDKSKFPIVIKANN